MNIQQKINSISTKEELENTIKSIKFKITFWRGRKFSIEGAEGELSFNHLILELYQKRRQQPELFDASILKKLKKLDQKAESSLHKKNCFVRGMLAIKRYFSSSRERKIYRRIQELLVPKARHNPVDDFSQLKESLAFLDHYVMPESLRKEYVIRKDDPRPEVQEAWKAANHRKDVEAVLVHFFEERLKKDNFNWALNEFGCSFSNGQVKIDMIGVTEGLLKSHGTLRLEGGLKGHRNYPNHDFLTLNLSFSAHQENVAASLELLYGQFKAAVEFWEKIKRQIESECIENGQFKTKPSKIISQARMSVSLPEVSLKDEKMTVNFHPVLLAKGKWPLSEEKAQCFYGLATVVSSDETFDVTQFAGQLSDKWKKDVEETVGSYIGMASGKVPMFGFGFVSEGQAKEEATNEEIKKLDEWLGLEDKLIDAFNTSNKSEVEKFLSESVIRKASIKFHPDKAAQNNMSTEEANQKFQEFTELVKKAREKLSRLN